MKPVKKTVNEHVVTKLKSNLLENNGKTALLILGGLSIAGFMYKSYKALPTPHTSIPMAPDMHPLFGHIGFIRNNWSRLHDALYDLLKDKDIVATAMPDFHQIWIQTPELIKWVFTDEFEQFHKGDSSNEKIRSLFGHYGQGIFVSDGAAWRFHRKIGSRMFSVRNLRDYMYGCCISTTKNAISILEKLRISNKSIDINDILGRMTFDCFTTIAFGTSFDSMLSYPKQHPFGEAFDKLIELLPKRSSQPFWKLKRFLNVDYEAEIAKYIKVTNDFSHNLITEKRKNAKQRLHDESGKNVFDLFSLYEAHSTQPISDDDMKFIAFNFIIAGRDTTRMLLSWFLYDLTKYPEIKKKIIEEIDEYKEDELNYLKITKEFKYLEATLCESLRVHPVVPSSARRPKKDIKIPEHILPGGFMFKKNDLITVHHFTISKLERFYKNPFKFDPMRFYEKGVRTFEQNIYPFFNQFPRLCLGRDFALMEAKIFVFNFLKYYDFEAVPNQEITYSPGIIFNMKNGFKINLIKRE